MPAPAMPTTMRGDGRGTKARPKVPVGRYFAGKSEGHPAEDSDASDSAASRDRDGHHHHEEDDEEEEEEGDLDDDDDEVAGVPQRHASLTHQDGSVVMATPYSSEYETEDGPSASSESEEEAPRRVLLKPTFVPKHARAGTTHTHHASTTLVPSSSSSIAPVEETAAPPPGQTTLDDAQKRRVMARELLEQQIRQEAANDALLLHAHTHNNDADDVDDTDDAASRDMDVMAWKIRELQRLKRDKTAGEAREREREQVDARRHAPEQDVRLREDVLRVAREREAKVQARKAEREAAGGGGGGGHAGGFYQDDPVVKRAAHGSVEDTQAGVGLRGAVRRTGGLLDQDTSRDSIWHDGTSAAKRTLGTRRHDEDEFIQQKKKKRL